MYFIPNITQVINGRRMRRAGHVVRMEGRRIQGFGGETLWEVATRRA